MDLTLFVTYGRTGSTLLMRALGQHPKVLVRNPFPFETRTAQYLFLAPRLGIDPLGRPLCYEGATYQPADDLDDRMRGIAHLALQSSPFPISMWQAYYRIGPAEGRQEAVAVVEKAMGLVLAREMLGEHSGFRLISLIRDPRTTVRSIRAFNQQRGFLSFGEEEGVDTLFDRFIAFNMHALELAQLFEGRSLVVRSRGPDRPTREGGGSTARTPRIAKTSRRDATDAKRLGLRGRSHQRAQNVWHAGGEV